MQRRNFRNLLGATAATWEGHGSYGSANSETTNPGCLYYQFGRKDPMARTLGYSIETTGATTFAYTVKNPMTYIGTNSSSNWATQDTSANNTWLDKNVAKDTDGKSIFDPSPIGWRVPIQGVWSNFSLENFTILSSGRVHSDDHAAYYPNSGRRDNTNSSLVYIGSSGMQWTSTPVSTTTGSYLYFDSNSVSPLGYGNRARGLALRAIRE